MLAFFRNVLFLVSHKLLTTNEKTTNGGAYFFDYQRFKQIRGFNGSVHDKKFIEHLLRR